VQMEGSKETKRDSRTGLEREHQMDSKRAGEEKQDEKKRRKR
jgi:hypothetical protein